MSHLGKQVNIILHTAIDDAGEVEETKVEATGQLVQKGKFHVLTFKEQIDGHDALHNFITIRQDNVAIKRTGAVTMHQKFITKAVTENVYQHPHGKMHMETFTEWITYRPATKRSAGKLNISYTLKLNGQNERKHSLELLFSEEEFHGHS